MAQALANQRAAGTAPKQMAVIRARARNPPSRRLFAKRALIQRVLKPEKSSRPTEQASILGGRSAFKSAMIAGERKSSTITPPSRSITAMSWSSSV